MRIRFKSSPIIDSTLAIGALSLVIGSQILLPLWVNACGKRCHSLNQSTLSEATQSQLTYVGKFVTYIKPAHANKVAIPHFGLVFLNSAYDFVTSAGIHPHNVLDCMTHSMSTTHEHAQTTFFMPDFTSEVNNPLVVYDICELAPNQSGVQKELESIYAELSKDPWFYSPSQTCFQWMEEKHESLKKGPVDNQANHPSY